MEREKKLRKFLEILGVTSKNYWTAFLFSFFCLFFLLNCLFLLIGRIFLGGLLFSAPSMGVLLVQLAGWDLSQIGLAMLLSSWITSRHSALCKPSSNTDLGYTINFFVVILIGNLSLFFFPSPSQLPTIFFVLPHSCLVRGFYHQVKHCVEGSCSVNPLPRSTEHWVSLILPFIHAAAFFFTGLAYYDGKSYRAVVKAVSFRVKAASHTTEQSVNGPTPDLTVELSVSHTGGEDQVNPEFVPNDNGMEASAIEEARKMRGLPPSQQEYSLVCRDLQKSFVDFL